MIGHVGREPVPASPGVAFARPHPPGREEQLNKEPPFIIFLLVFFLDLTLLIRLVNFLFLARLLVLRFLLIYIYILLKKS